MQSHSESFVHQLSIIEIQRILERGAWQTLNQSLNSADTNDNSLINADLTRVDTGENTAGVNAFIDIPFNKKIHRVLDVGGGRYDNNTKYLQYAKNIQLLVWDPYNRSEQHNQEIYEDVTNTPVDAVTSMSVLNVIPECEARLAHIITIFKALPLHGNAYFKIWSGADRFQGTYVPTATEVSFQANAYADRFLREIQIVFGIDNVKIDSSVDNLIMAKKTRQTPSSREEIAFIQLLSHNDLPRIVKKQNQTMHDALSMQFSLFSKSISLFKSVESNAFIHQKNSNQSAHDKRYGLTIRRNSSF